MSSQSERPDRTTMAGMIWNANHVLAAALDPKRNGVPTSLFEQQLKGILLISTIEAGFIFSGTVGTGILMAYHEDEKRWSPPCAIGLTGMGWGFLVGAAVKDIMVFIFDESALEAVAGDHGFKFGTQGNLTLGTIGRNVDVAVNVSDGGVGSTVSVAFTKGLFAGLSLEGAVVGVRTRVNAKFYGKQYSAMGILYEEGIELPEGSLMPEVYVKLDKLLKGATHEVSPEEEALVQAALEEAKKLGELEAQSSDVVKVDAKAEAAKEAAASS